ncbi:MAG: phage tail protein [Phycisphaerae bacterium]
MATLALGAVGAAIGGTAFAGVSVFGMSAASIGWAVGSSLGSYLFAPDGPDVEGPRLNDLQVNSPAYGSPRPETWGTYRQGGQIIDSTKIKETKHTESTGGKGGGGGGTQTTYTYSITMAVALGAGPITGVRRIWANGTLIWTRDVDADAQSISASRGNIIVYNGTEDQDPDPTLEALHGAGNVPAYRGTPYIVFKDLQLEDFGNRPPQIEAEVVRAGSECKFGGCWNSVINFDDGGLSFWDSSQSNIKGVFPFADGTLAAWISVGYPDYEEMIAVSFDFGETWVNGIELTSSFDLKSVYSVGILGRNSLYVRGYSRPDTDNVTEIHEIKNFGTKAGDILFQLDNFSSDDGVMPIGDGNIVVGIGDRGDDSGIYKSSRLSLSGTLVYVPDHTNGKIDHIVGNSSFMIAAHEDDDNGACDILVSYNGGDSWSKSYRYEEYDLVTGAIVFDGVKAVVAFGNNVQIRTSDGGNSWSTSSAGDLVNFAYHDGELIADSSSGVESHGGVYVSHDDGATWETRYDDGNISKMKHAEGEDLLVGVNSLYNDEIVISAKFVTNDGVYLSDIVTDLCTNAGLSTSDIDVTELDDNVPGFARTKSMTARAAITPLQRAYFFDAVESDWVLKWIKRGGPSVLTVTDEELAARPAGDDAPPMLSETRQQEVELPREVVVNHLDVNSDYEKNAQRAQRIITRSEHTEDLDLPLAESADKIAQVAEVLLYNAWLERTRYSTPLPPRYEWLDPGDVITVEEGGNSFEMRIVRIKNGDVLEIEAVAESAGIYDSTASGSTLDRGPQTVSERGPTNAVLLDIPILRDADNDSGFYVAANGYLSGWTGSVLYRSTDDGETYDALASVLSGSPIGTTTDALADGPTEIIDRANSVNVSLPQGDLSSITDSALMDGQSNAAAIGSNATGWEILQFRDATLESDGSYTLSHFIRGRRGTEWMTGQHSTGDTFVLLQSSSLERAPMDANAIGSERLYKAVTTGKFIGGTDAEEFTNHGVGLEPYSPAHLKARDNGDGTFDVTWVRRTRIGGEWRDNVDVPLGEDEEKYRVKVFSGGTEQSSEDVTSPSATVTASAGDTIKVAQVSATVGAGYYAEVTV